MENTNKSSQPGTFVNPTSVRVSKDKRYLIIALPGNFIVRKPIAYFRAILANITLPDATTQHS